MNLKEIEKVTSPQAPEFIHWSKTRLDRVIVDYLLREGMSTTARRVAEESQIEVKNNDVKYVICITLFYRIWWIYNYLRNLKKLNKR